MFCIPVASTSAAAICQGILFNKMKWARIFDCNGFLNEWCNDRWQQNLFLLFVDCNILAKLTVTRSQISKWRRKNLRYTTWLWRTLAPLNVENRRYPIIWNAMTSNVACRLFRIQQLLSHMGIHVGSILPSASKHPPGVRGWLRLLLVALPGLLFTYFIRAKQSGSEAAACEARL